MRNPKKPLPEEVAKRWTGEVDVSKRFPGAAEEVGGGAYLRLDLSQQEDGQRLREAVRNRRGVRLRSDDAAYAETCGSCVGVSTQSLKG